MYQEMQQNGCAIILGKDMMPHLLNIASESLAYPLVQCMDEAAAEAM